jgi:hypothetical protein
MGKSVIVVWLKRLEGTALDGLGVLHERVRRDS